MPYTWKQFKDAVKVFLPIDKDRSNVQEYIEMHTRQAVLDLQIFVERYRRGHLIQYGPRQFVTHNKASLGRLPSANGVRFREGDIVRSKAGEPTEVLDDNLIDNWTHTGLTTVVPVVLGFTYRYTKGIETNLVNGVNTYTTSQDFIATGDTVTLNHLVPGQLATAKIQRVRSGSECLCQVHPVNPWPWERRQELIDGQVTLLDNNGYIAIDPEHATFYVYPAILAEEEIDEQTYSYCFNLRWDGCRADFGDGDRVPFDEGAVLAAAYWVDAELARKVDHDLTTSATLKSDYARERLKLHINR